VVLAAAFELKPAVKWVLVTLNTALMGPKGAAALHHQCDAFEWRALGRDMGLAQRLAAGHDVAPVLTARIAPSQTSLPALRALNAVSRAAPYGV
jgi:hypothetical protein